MPKIPYHNPVSSTRSKVDPQHRQRVEDRKFYNGSTWRKLRALKLSLDPLCVRCEADGLTVVAVHVHHVKARKAHPDLALDIENLQGLCASCHSRTENLERGRSR